MSKARLVITAPEVAGRSPADVIAAYGVSRSWLCELMPYTDSRGRPTILMHPNIVRGVASYRLETLPIQQAPEKGRSAKASKPGKPRPADAE